MQSQVVVLAGPSGAGKSRLAARSGLPVLRLDDLYREGDAEGLPHITDGQNAGLVDWDDVGSWDHDAALAVIEQLCATGRADVPVYDIATSARTGSRVLDLDGSALFAAEGIFAAEIVEECRTRGLLAAAYCVTQHRLVTFARRLGRDLSERRKPPPVLVRRGLALLREQPAVVARAVAAGCEVVTGDEGLVRIRTLLGHRAVRAAAAYLLSDTDLAGPEHGVVGDSTLCGLPRDEVVLVRHLFAPTRSTACPACVTSDEAR